MITAKIPPLCKKIVTTSSNLKASEIGSVTRMLTGQCLKPRGKMREWTEEQMEKAIQDIINGILGFRRAALEYQVPRSMLSNRVTGRVCPGAAPGPPEYLCEAEE